MSLSNTTKGYDLQSMRSSWGWLLALGIVLLILGFIALSSTVATTLVSTVLLGIVLLIGGVMQFVWAFRGGGAAMVVLRVIVGIFFLLAGWALIARPSIAALTITFLLGIFFLIVGVMRMILALLERGQGWGWMMLGGFAALVLGILLFANWPVSGLYAIGIFIGIDLIFSGVSFIVSAFAVRDLPPTAAPAM